MKHAYLTLLLCSACAGPVDGVTFTGRPVDEQAALAVMHYAMQHAGDIGAQAYPLDGMTVYVQTAPLGDAVGIYRPAGIDLAMVEDFNQTPTDNIQRTALCHEMAHMLIGDGGHTRPEVWGQDGFVMLCWKHFGGMLNGVAVSAQEFR